MRRTGFWATFRTSDDKCIIVGKTCPSKRPPTTWTSPLSSSGCGDFFLHPQSLPPDLRDKSLGVHRKKTDIKTMCLEPKPFKSWLQRVFSSPLKFTSFKLCGNSLVLPQSLDVCQRVQEAHNQSRMYLPTTVIPTYDGNMRVSSPFFTTTLLSDHEKSDGFFRIQRVSQLHKQPDES